MSVKLTTPTRRPDMRAPGIADADIDGPVGEMKGVLGEWSAIVEANGSAAAGADAARGGVMWCCPLGDEKEEEWLEVGTRVAV